MSAPRARKGAPPAGGWVTWFELAAVKPGAAAWPFRAEAGFGNGPATRYRLRETAEAVRDVLRGPSDRRVAVVQCTQHEGGIVFRSTEA